MTFDINHLYGVYRVQDIITYENGVKIDDPVTMAFLPLREITCSAS